jgi:hypothetical protein
MPSTLEDIQRKHEEAMEDIRNQAVENLHVEEDYAAVEAAITRASAAFAEFLDYHKRIKAATKQ